MLDNETKRKIDSARNILVGKVPDPKAQIDQITTALIYKFMDDMDREAESFGGNAKFLVNELESYKWANLMDKALGGSERLNLYMSALLEFAKSSHIPDIFRTIFKDAFLPYRDAETLNLFLKEIDYFDYDHSENLGNAFEYLLSILGSQGDAGQFRTPRHIIDFIVEILEPKKDETVLDPSCGTAGFLISAYKYIIANNKLNPDEKKRLMNNFIGYDISPDMVRLSLVNMYLHSFPNPRVYEYDTLTSEDRWSNSFDVILANPPFMTPKGGIRPHNRFSVQANRSEVLFVDYIAEHLSLNGRAGIIVPEGIIFQSANAYKALRKMLVDNGFLWAVVSLPAGVFQPYSGVKTSILLLDRNIAKRSENILFVKISNDGYDLGAQRREIAKNDLPEALEILTSYRLGSEDLASPKGIEVPSQIFHIVPKSKIAENGDYNLTGDRYKKNIRVEQSSYPMVRLGEVCELVRGITYSKNDEVEKDGYKVLRANNINLDGTLNLADIKQITKSLNFKSTQQLQKNDIFICLASGSKEHVGKVSLIKNLDDYYFGGFMGVIRKINPNINVKYLYAHLSSKIFNNYLREKIAGANINNLSAKILYDFEIPLPPLEIQNQIVGQIEEWQKIIDGAKQVINSYRPTITIDPSWEIVKLGDVCEINNGYVLTNFEENGSIACIKVSDMNIRENSNCIYTSNHWIHKTDKKILPVNSIIFPKRGAAIATNKKRLTKIACLIDNNCMGLIIKDTNLINPLYVFSFMLDFDLPSISNSAGVALINNGDISNVNLPLPPLEIQNQIVEQIEKERQAVESCKSLVEIFEAKIKAKIDEVWGNV